jgi:hypothetical protein
MAGFQFDHEAMISAEYYENDPEVQEAALRARNALGDLADILEERIAAAVSAGETQEVLMRAWHYGPITGVITILEMNMMEVPESDEPRFVAIDGQDRLNGKERGE